MRTVKRNSSSIRRLHLSSGCWWYINVTFTRSRFVKNLESSSMHAVPSVLSRSTTKEQGLYRKPLSIVRFTYSVLHVYKFVAVCCCIRVECPTRYLFLVYCRRKQRTIKLIKNWGAREFSIQSNDFNRACSIDRQVEPKALDKAVYCGIFLVGQIAREFDKSSEGARGVESMKSRGSLELICRLTVSHTWWYEEMCLELCCYCVLPMVQHRDCYPVSPT